MVIIEIPSAVTTIHPIISIVVGFILGIFSTPLSNWVFSKDNEYCAFDPHLTLQDRKENQYSVRHGIIVTKYFGKTTNINCPHYKSKNTKIIKNKGERKYRYCKFGESTDSEKEDIKKCPFYK